MSASCWSVRQNVAEWHAQRVKGTLDLLRPQRGVINLEIDGVRLEHLTLFGTFVPRLLDPIPAEMLVDSYVRQGDLIVTYAPTQMTELHSQIYWRNVTNGSAVGLHWVLSVLTPRLDGKPCIHLRHKLGEKQGSIAVAPARGVERELTEGYQVELRESAVARDGVSSSRPLLIYRPANIATSIVLMSYPNDVVRFEVAERESKSAQYEADFEMLDEHLEKGVIRRIQAAAWFVPREADHAEADRLYDDFLRCPPPLTT